MQFKITLLLSLFLGLFLCTSASAQYKFFVGGQLGFSSIGESNSDNKTNNTSLLPYIGYSVNENIIAGIGLGVSRKRIEYDGSDDYYESDRTIFLNPFARYRVAPSERMGFYGELGLRLGLRKVRVVSDGEDLFDPHYFTTFSIYLGPGFDYAFADRWVVNALWGAFEYSSTKERDVDGSDNSIGLNLNPVNVAFSLNYLF